MKRDATVQLRWFEGPLSLCWAYVSGTVLLVFFLSAGRAPIVQGSGRAEFLQASMLCGLRLIDMILHCRIMQCRITAVSFKLYFQLVRTPPCCAAAHVLQGCTLCRSCFPDRRTNGRTTTSPWRKRPPLQAPQLRVTQLQVAAPTAATGLSCGSSFVPCDTS